MKLKFSLFGLVDAVTFVLAFLCLMFSYLTEVMFLPAMFLFACAFGILTYILFVVSLKHQKEIDEKQEVIVMELAEGENGETYVMQDQKKEKKQRRKKRMQKFDRVIPSLLSGVVTVFMLYMFIASVAKIV